MQIFPSFSKGKQNVRKIMFADFSYIFFLIDV